MNNEYLTIKEAANYLNASISNLRWHIHNGRLPISYRDIKQPGSPNMFSINDLDILANDPIWRGRRPILPENKPEKTHLLRWRDRPRQDEHHKSGCIVHWSERFRYNDRTFVPITCAECGTKFDKSDAGIFSSQFTGCCQHCSPKRRKQSEMKNNGYTSRDKEYLLRHIRTFSESEQQVLRQMPLCNDIYILEHRAIMAINLGRPLLSSEAVHHINGDKKDNRIENLQLFDVKEHSKRHSDQLNKIITMEARIKELEELLFNPSH